jgi:hypothetical protein
MRSCVALITLVTVAILVSGELSAQQQADNPVDSRQFPSSLIPFDAVPDLREEDHPLKFEGKKDRSIFVVPVPMSSPTFGSGLILGGAYFYQQSEEQKKTQPASFTGAAAAYTHNKSWFAGVVQQNYFKEDTWRFGALAAYADFKLELVPPPEGSEESLLDWLVQGGIFMTSVSRRIGGDWFLGLSARYLDIQQDFDLESELPEFNPDESIRSPGIGLNLQCAASANVTPNSPIY